MTESSRVATLRAELRDDTAFVATPTPRLSWTVESSRSRLAAGIRRAQRRPRDRDHRRARQRARRLAVRAARARRAPRRHGARARDVGRRDPHGASRCASRPASSPTASGSPSRSASPSPTREAQPVLRAHARSRSTRPCRARPALLDRARRRRARAQRLAGLGRRPLPRLDQLPRPARARDRRRHRARPRGRERARRDRRGRLVHREVRVLRASPPASTAPSRRSSPSCRVTYTDGTTETLARPATAGRRSATGPIVDSGIYPGETQDLAPAPYPAGRTTAFDAMRHLGARARVGAAALPGYENVPVPEARIAPPVRRIETLPGRRGDPDALRRTHPRLRPEPRRPPAAPRRRRRRHDPDASGTPRCSKTASSASVPCATRRRPPRSRSRATASRSLESRFSFYGFRYAEIDGWRATSTRPTSRPSCCTPT